MNYESIEIAEKVLKNIITPTPTLPAEPLSDIIGGNVFYKVESMQRTGSFKIRGAYTQISQLDQTQKQRGVITHSAGNHAQGVALAAKLHGIRATVVMPEYTPLAKVQATRRLGAEVILSGLSFDDAGLRAKEIQEKEKLISVHAFNDFWTIAGQGTLGLEIAGFLPPQGGGTVIVPVGGGGMISGIAIALRAIRPKTRIIGVQSSGCPSVILSQEAGKLISVENARTICDGIAVKRPGELTLPLINSLVDELVTVDDDSVGRAIVHILQESRILVEGAGAVGVAALLEGKIKPKDKEPTIVILSGGNIDTNFLARVIEHVLVKQGRYLRIRTGIPDRPGNLAPLVNAIASKGANVIDIAHRRAAWQLPLDRVGIELILEVRDESHGQSVILHLEEQGYHVERFGVHEWPV